MTTFITRHRNTLSTLALVALLIGGLANLAFGSLDRDPFRRTITISIQLTETGGLHDASDVTYRGAKVGAVTDIRLTSDGVVAEAVIESAGNVPASVRARVANLSAAGEQYLDLIPTSSSPVTLSDHAVITTQNSSGPRPFPGVLSRVATFMGQIDIGTLATTIHELDTAMSQGGNELATIIDAADTLVGGLYDVLPQTRNLVISGRRNLQLLADIGPSADRFSASFSDLGAQLSGSSNELRTLFGLTPTGLSSIRNVVGYNRGALGDMLKSLDDIAVQAQLRTPALRLLMPSLLQAASAWSLVIHDGAFNISADITPRPTCEYDNPASAPAQATNPLPLKYLYCTSTSPVVGQRGAHNAPRPDGDDTAGPPPGATGHERVSG